MFENIDQDLEKLISKVSDKKLKDTPFVPGITHIPVTGKVIDSYDLLNLISFFTSGPKESKSWSCQTGTLAPDAGAKIHTDFKKGFIKAEVISYSDFSK